MYDSYYAEITYSFLSEKGKEVIQVSPFETLSSIIEECRKVWDG